MTAASALVAPSGAEWTVESVVEWFLHVGVETAQLFNSDPTQAVHAIHQQGSVLYVPTGWLCLERTVQGPLVYGARKTVAMSTPASLAAYDFCIRMKDAAKVSSANMQLLRAEMARAATA